MPCSLPAASTTGTALMPCRARVAATVEVLSSGRTEMILRVMTADAVSPMFDSSSLQDFFNLW